jgi:ribosome-associated protein
VVLRTCSRRPTIEARELADKLMELAAAKMASRIVLLDLQGVSLIADYFLICSGESERQLDAISTAVQEGMEAEGVRAGRVEGTPASGWILIDYGAVLLHVFDLERRDFYQLERLWSRARTVAVMP